MFECFQPAMQITSVEKISVEELFEAGIKGLIIDLDNTVTRWNELVVEEKVALWLGRVKKEGIQACVVSNNKKKSRVATVADYLDVPYVFRATKPRRRAFLEAMKMMGTGAENTAVIGDQLFTDVLGGNRLHLYTILVAPISDHEFAGTKILRMGERVLWWLMKKPASANSNSPKFP
ncbi:MAG: YqeG family HAD IIIA-type phosphatase [Peptococcaceae bacterium]|jgi:HAD superfamily phosphatase (TIGR01668 family)|nr:YqeG family HAD IIIA-type phosphatase [Peptococcaceae bacterium]